MPPVLQTFRVDDVDGPLFKQLPERGLRIQGLTGNDWYVGSASDLGQGVDVFGGAGFLEPEGVDTPNRVGHANRVHRGEPAMHLDQQVNVRPDGIAHGIYRTDSSRLVFA